MKKKKIHSPKGFTLIEMIVVIVILGVLTVYSVPYFGGFANRTRLDSACRNWIAYANYARSKAVTSGVNYRLNCDLDQQSYWLTYEALTTGMAGQYISPKDEWGKTVSLDSSLKMVSIELEQINLQETGLVQILFTPRGTTNDLVITFRNYDQEERIIEVTGITGFAKIQSSEEDS